MKKFIFIIFIISLLFISCGKDEEEIEYKEKSGMATTEVEKTERIVEKTKTVDSDRTMVKYINETYEIEFTVYYKIFTNFNHPNGYILIDEITRCGAGLYVRYLVYGSEDPETYIKTIHSHMLFDAEQTIVPGERVNLEGNETFRVIFRTAEAMIIASIKKDSNSVTQEEVSFVAMRMRGRISGTSINN